MILEIPYMRFSEHGDTLSSPAVLSAAMVLSYHKIPFDLLDLDKSFCSTILSDSFNREYLEARNDYPDKVDRALLCIRTLFDTQYPELSTRLFCTSIDKIHGSFTKRMMPIIVSGMFPMLSGKTKSHIIILGMDDGDFIVHDPLGNAITNYRDRNGQFVRYPFTFLDQALGASKPLLLITE